MLSNFAFKFTLRRYRVAAAEAAARAAAKAEAAAARAIAKGKVGRCCSLKPVET